MDRASLRRSLRALRGERGTSVVELLVFMVMLGLVAAAGSALLIVAVRSEPRISERANAIQRGRVLQERLARELRQSYLVESASPSQVTFLTFVRRVQCGGPAPTDPSASAIPCQVTYVCTAGTCTRSETNPAGTAAPNTARLVEGISNSDVFSYAPSSSDPGDVGYVATKLVFPAEGGDDAVTLEDGVDLRNR
jgi:hypothetical protein